MDQSTPVSRPKDCPECGAPFPDDGTNCWLCGWKLGDPVGVRPKRQGPSRANPYAPPAPRDPADLKWTFSLSTLFLWTALVAVVMGVVRIAPGLGILLGFFCFPAALHTTAVASYRKNRWRRALTVREKIFVFIESFALFLSIAIAVVASAVGAVAVICMPSAKGRDLPEMALTALGAVVGVALAGLGIYALGRVLWRSKR
jgi:hypothetical protein